MSRVLAVALIVCAARATAQALGTNLVTNPGCESGVTGWSVTAGNYGSGCDASGYPGQQGTATFWGGAGGASVVAYQDIDVSPSAATIDKLHLAFNASAYLGGATTEDDSAQVNFYFFDAAWTTLRTLTVGPVTKADRASTSQLLLREGAGCLPVGTRTVRVELQHTRVGTGNNDAFIDDVTFSLFSTVSPATIGDDLVFDGSFELGCWFATAGFAQHTYTANAVSFGRMSGEKYAYAAGVASATWYQEVDLSAIATDIDAGTVDYTMSAALGGALTESDEIRATFTFLDVGGSALRTFELGTPTPTMRNSLTGFLGWQVNECASDWQVSGARSVKISFECTRVTGSDCDGYVDDVVFIVTPQVIESAAQYGALYLTDNLIKNGDAEIGTTEHWTRPTGLVDVVAADLYGANATSRPRCSQKAFRGGLAAVDSSIVQWVPLCNYSDWIDTGAEAQLTAWLGGYRTEDDAPTVTVEWWLGDMSRAVGSISIGPGDAAARSERDGTFLFNATQPAAAPAPAPALKKGAAAAPKASATTVPTSVRWAKVTVSFAYSASSVNDGLADDITLRLVTKLYPVPPWPENTNNMPSTLKENTWLLANGGAENGLTGWSDNNNVVVGTYSGSEDTDYFPPGMNSSYFAAADVANATISQTVDVSAFSNPIDANKQMVELSAWMGAFANSTDIAMLLFEALDATYVPLYTGIVGTALPCDRDDKYRMKPYWLRAQAPQFTRYIRITLQFLRLDAAGGNDAIIDDVRLHFVPIGTTSVVFNGGFEQGFAGWRKTHGMPTLDSYNGAAWAPADSGATFLRAQRRRSTLQQFVSLCDYDTRMDAFIMNGTFSAQLGGSLASADYATVTLSFFGSIFMGVTAPPPPTLPPKIATPVKLVGIGGAKAGFGGIGKGKGISREFEAKENDDAAGGRSFEAESWVHGPNLYKTGSTITLTGPTPAERANATGFVFLTENFTFPTRTRMALITIDLYGEGEANMSTATAYVDDISLTVTYLPQPVAAPLKGKAGSAAKFVIPAPLPVWTGKNALFNSDFEAGDTRFWAGNMVAGAYGDARLPGTKDNAPVGKGTYLAWPNREAHGWLRQTVDLSPNRAFIASGGQNATLAAWLGGTGWEADSIAVTVFFHDANGNEVGEYNIGPVSACSRFSAPGLYLRLVSVTVHEAAVSATVFINATKYEGNFNDAFVDSVELALDPMLVTLTAEVSLSESLEPTPSHTATKTHELPTPAPPTPAPSTTAAPTTTTAAPTTTTAAPTPAPTPVVHPTATATLTYSFAASGATGRRGDLVRAHANVVYSGTYPFGSAVTATVVGATAGLFVPSCVEDIPTGCTVMAGNVGYVCAVPLGTTATFDLDFLIPVGQSAATSHSLTLTVADASTTHATDTVAVPMTPCAATTVATTAPLMSATAYGTTVHLTGTALEGLPRFVLVGPLLSPVTITSGTAAAFHIPSGKVNAVAGKSALDTTRSGAGSKAQRYFVCTVMSPKTRQSIEKVRDDAVAAFGITSARRQGPPPAYDPARFSIDFATLDVLVIPDPTAPVPPGVWGWGRTSSSSGSSGGSGGGGSGGGGSGGGASGGGGASSGGSSGPSIGRGGVRTSSNSGGGGSGGSGGSGSGGSGGGGTFTVPVFVAGPDGVSPNCTGTTTLGDGTNVSSVGDPTIVVVTDGNGTTVGVIVYFTFPGHPSDVVNSSSTFTPSVNGSEVAHSGPTEVVMTVVVKEPRTYAAVAVTTTYNVPTYTVTLLPSATDSYRASFQLSHSSGEPLVGLDVLVYPVEYGHTLYAARTATATRRQTSCVDDNANLSTTCTRSSGLGSGATWSFDIWASPPSYFRRTLPYAVHVRCDNAVWRTYRVLIGPTGGFVVPGQTTPPPAPPAAPVVTADRATTAAPANLGNSVRGIFSATDGCGGASRFWVPAFAVAYLVTLAINWIRARSARRSCENIDKIDTYDVDRSHALWPLHLWIGAAMPCTSMCAPTHATLLFAHAAVVLGLLALLRASFPTAFAQHTVETQALSGAVAAIFAMALRPLLHAVFFMYRTVDQRHKYRQACARARYEQDLVQFGVKQRGIFGVTGDTMMKMAGQEFEHDPYVLQQRRMKASAALALKDIDDEEDDAGSAPQEAMNTSNLTDASNGSGDDEVAIDDVDCGVSKGPTTSSEDASAEAANDGAHSTQASAGALTGSESSQHDSSLQHDTSVFYTSDDISPRNSIRIDARSFAVGGHVIGIVMMAGFILMTLHFTGHLCTHEMNSFWYAALFAALFDIVALQAMFIALINLWRWVIAEDDEEYVHELHPIHGQRRFVGELDVIELAPVDESPTKVDPSSSDEEAF